MRTGFRLPAGDFISNDNDESQPHAMVKSQTNRREDTAEWNNPLDHIPKKNTKNVAVTPERTRIKKQN